MMIRIIVLGLFIILFGLSINSVISAPGSPGQGTGPTQIVILSCDENGDVNGTPTAGLSSSNPINIGSGTNDCTDGDDCGDCMADLIRDGCKYLGMQLSEDNDSPHYAIVIDCTAAPFL